MYDIKAEPDADEAVARFILENPALEFSPSRSPSPASSYLESPHSFSLLLPIISRKRACSRLDTHITGADADNDGGSAMYLASQFEPMLPHKMTVPLRATHASAEMRAMMSVFRLNPFTSLNGVAVRGDGAWDRSSPGPLELEPVLLEIELDLPGYGGELTKNDEAVDIAGSNRGRKDAKLGGTSHQDCFNRNYQDDADDHGIEKTKERLYSLRRACEEEGHRGIGLSSTSSTSAPTRAYAQAQLQNARTDETRSSQVSPTSLTPARGRSFSISSSTSPTTSSISTFDEAQSRRSITYGSGTYGHLIISFYSSSLSPPLLFFARL